MKVMVIAATVLSVFPIICALFMPDYFLGDTQNAVEDVDLTGEHVGVPRDDQPTDERRV